MNVDLRRTRLLNSAPATSGPICYWMSRDQRVHDNWALLFAQQLAQEKHVPLFVCFNVANNFLGAPLRHFAFMLEGLIQVVEELAKLEIPFFLLSGDPVKTIPQFAQEMKLGALVTDFSPLRNGQSWRKEVAKQLNIPVFEVDAHNIVPCWVASPKQEFAAYTFRPKIHKWLPEFLTHFPKVMKQSKVPLADQTSFSVLRKLDIDQLLSQLQVDRSVTEVKWLQSGETAAQVALQTFIETRLKNYDQDRNDPTLEAQSDLSPYLHFGQLSAQRVALELEHHHDYQPSVEAFLEELIVRRELSDNFCYYQPAYDQVTSFPSWALKTLAKHAQDPRPVLYSLATLEAGQTADPAWNAAQHELVMRGKLHGYMRMYWAKQLLNWTKDAAQALKWCIYLNDKYSLDGRDPNGYVGILWSLGGVHDRVWFERPIFGQVRYMNANGLQHKFKIAKYIAKWDGQN